MLTRKVFYCPPTVKSREGRHCWSACTDAKTNDCKTCFQHFECGERVDLVVGSLTPEQEVGGLIPTSTVLCP